jgi:hypothetical protein
MTIPPGYAFGAKILSACALVIGLIGFGWWLGGRAGAVEVAELKADHAEVMTEIAQDARHIAEEIRKAEQQTAQDLAKVARDYEDKRHEIAAIARASVLDDIRAGRIRLRGYGPRPAVSPTGQESASAGQRDGEAVGAGEDPPDMVPRWWVEERAAESEAVGAEADAQLAACHAVIRVYTGEPAPE